MRHIVLSAILAAMIFSGQNARAGAILENDFVFAQASMLDLTILGIVSDLGPPIDLSASFHYEGQFQIFPDAHGDTIGAFTGVLSGLYLGQGLSGDFSGTLAPVTPTDPDFTLTGESSEPGSGKKLGVNLKATVDDGKGTASVSGKVGTKDVKGDLKKSHDDKKKETTYEGQVKFNDQDYYLTIKIDDNPGKDGKKHYTSALIDHFNSYDNPGTVSLAPVPPPPGGQAFIAAINVGISPAPAPEPSSLIFFGLGTLSLLGYNWRCRQRAA